MTYHFHGIPTSASSHHITVERVQDTLVRELQRLVEDDHRVALFDLVSVVALLGL